MHNMRTDCMQLITYWGRLALWSLSSQSHKSPYVSSMIIIIGSISIPSSNKTYPKPLTYQVHSLHRRVNITALAT